MGSLSNMLALRWHGNQDLRIDEVAVPKLRPGWVKVKNEWAGICGSGEKASERTNSKSGG
jgi:(R,R)-butanediol dehydrogenase/meso-butanediol dehydrogenase/diacetyl reductase